MAHAKPEDLKDLAALLEQLRGIETLREKSPGCFYRKGKSVLHFHTQKGRRYAHVMLPAFQDTFSANFWILLS